MTKEERNQRIVARGEHSNHCHVIVGDVVSIDAEGTTIEIGPGGGKIRHLLETEWMKGNEVWTKEHKDIDLPPGRHRVIIQTEFDPYEGVIRQVTD